MGNPLISVVTPFHNTAKYLPQCIESVLGQTLRDFEYVLINNCSTDESGVLAESYAKKDSRIRVIHRSTLLPQVANYNAALSEISPLSQYCKIVQADDYIFPNCLELMAKAFEGFDSVGLVGAYDLKANVIRASGFPFRNAPWPGREVIRHYFRVGTFVFGSPTSLMYRSSLVRSCSPFFDDSRLHEDTEKCFEILKDWDFRFVHQVLAFIRTQDGSISSAVRDLQPDALDRYILVQRFGSAFLDEQEAADLKRAARCGYYEMLAQAAVQFRPEEFWSYHRSGLKTIGEEIDRSYLRKIIAKDVFRMILNPGLAFQTLVRRWKQDRPDRKVSDVEPSLPATPSN